MWNQWITNSKRLTSSNPDSISIRKLEQIVVDDSFLSFIQETNGCYLFDDALHICGLDKGNEYHDLFLKNDFINKCYGEISVNLFFFAEDIFGNQFAFSAEGIIFFNLENGEREWLCNSFDDWIDLIESDLEYFTGYALSSKWGKSRIGKGSESYLCPKVPFLLGGSYDIENLHAIAWKECLMYNSDIAKQVYGLPPGTDVEIRFT